MITVKKVFGLLSVLLFTGYANAYDCTGVAQYIDARTYNDNVVVQNVGTAYKCKVGGWCTVGGAYAPGSGWAWQDAWTNLGSCTTGGGSNSSSSSSVGGGGGGATGGSCPNWAAGTNYVAGVVVRYNGSYYLAVNDNPGYDPVISTWFWAPTASCPGGNGGSSSSTGGGGGGSCAVWAAGTSYVAGNVVSYNGSFYRAKFDNPGYDPVISTWFWEPVGSCSGGGSGSSSSNGGGNGGTGFSAIVSESQFNQMFPNRSSFYTYQGLVNAANAFPAFAGTGDSQMKIREAAAALANFSHETGGLIYITEIAKGEYCGDWDNNPSTCPCEPGKWYYGRGPIQLSWNGNYCTAGDALGLDLRRNPELVENDPTVAWKTALWFWMTQTGAGTRTAHDGITGNFGFGETIRTINGSKECNGANPAQVQSRIVEFQRFIRLLGGTEGSNLGC